VVISQDGVACGGEGHTKKLKQKAMRNLIKSHGTQPAVLMEFVDEVLEDLLPGFQNANCRTHLAEKIKNDLLKYWDAPLPNPPEIDWVKYGVIASILLPILLLIVNLIIS